MEQEIATRRLLLSLIAALERQGVLDKPTVEGILQAALTPREPSQGEPAKEDMKVDIKM